jgi:SAM-dependent methyltransferase
MKPVAHGEMRNSSAILAEDVYLRERTKPSIRDVSYLSLSDLKSFVGKCGRIFRGSVLDFGCGGSPYREEFGQCSGYVRADMLPGPMIDLVLTETGKTGEPDGSYEGVVSFQVLEHVPDPDEYIEECRRVLKKDGLLLLTTHGMFLEHKCPNDYYRWTSQGLENLVESHGFTLLESVKLTAGVRGAIQLQHYVVEEFIQRERTFGGLFLRLVRKLYRVMLLPLLNAIARRCLQMEAVVPSSANSNLYVGVGVLAKRR